MVKGIDSAKEKKKQWNTRIERDIKMADDLKVSGVQGGKVVGNNLALLSFIIGIPLSIIGLCGLFGILFGFITSSNMAIIILIVLINLIGLLLIIGGYFIYISD